MVRVKKKGKKIWHQNEIHNHRAVFTTARERGKTPWREKINLMSNEFLPSRASGQLRRGAGEGSERDDGKTPEVSQKKVERYARKVHETGVKRVVSCCTTFIPCVYR